MDEIIEDLNKNQYKWLLTGAAGFIGSNTLEFLLQHNQKVVAIDNLSSGFMKNIEDVIASVGSLSKNLEFFKLDITHFDELKEAMSGCEKVIHLAALGSIPRSVSTPLLTNASNVNGTLNVFRAAVELSIPRVVYASSSSVYGDHPSLPKIETTIGHMLSPYAASKRACEIYAESFANVYNIQLFGLRFFNVFGKRQNPNGPYAAVIPKWINALLSNDDIIINGDGETTRDFTYVKNIIQLIVKASIVNNISKKNMIFNGAFGGQISLKNLLNLINDNLDKKSIEPKYKNFREGDVRHSLASINLAKEYLGYNPQYCVEDGIKETCTWYQDKGREVHISLPIP